MLTIPAVYRRSGPSACTPGQIVAVEGLLRAKPDPSLNEIRVGVSGNLCRCGSYPHIFQAAARAAELKRKKGGRR